MWREDLGVYLAAVSHGRAGNVTKLQTLTGPATWYVASVEEAAVYAANGAAATAVGGGLCPSRNAALDAAHAAGQVCVQVSDDMTNVQFAVRDGARVVARPTTFAQAVAKMLDALEQTGAMLAGVAPTANPFYANVDAPVHTSAFVVGDLVAVRPSPERFDEGLRLKEDYMFTLDHMAAYGCVARCDDVLVTFLHRKNPGGACAVRTPALEQESIARLRAKYPQYVRDNPRRPDEILLKLPRRRPPGSVVL